MPCNQISEELSSRNRTSELLPLCYGYLKKGVQFQKIMLYTIASKISFADAHFAFLKTLYRLSHDRMIIERNGSIHSIEIRIQTKLKKPNDNAIK